jgi:hypothetical protein
MRNAKQQKILKLVSETPAEPLTPSQSCGTCQAKRQLDHVIMCLNAALLAATQPINPTSKGKR